MSTAPKQPIVALEHVSVARGKAVVLHDISLRIDAGEHVVVLGPNGCGKSTLLKTITCELYPLVRPGTRVSLMGRARWDLTELRRRMGVVQAELPGKPFLACTGFDAVLTGFFSSATLWPNLHVTAEMREIAGYALSLVNAVGLRGKLVGEMSAGQQRRVAIARALAGAARENETRMLLLDEPSNALDLPAQRDLRDLLRSLAHQGVAIWLITHHVEDVIPEIGRVVMMQDGRILADGSRQDLLTAAGLSSLFAARVDVREVEGYVHAW